MTDDLVKWLRSIRSPFAGQAADRIIAQAAEIERLRGKLQYMADTNLADDEYRTIAREALAGKAEQ